LTPRELEILQHIVAGKSNKEIAAELNLSANTVAVHRANIMDTLGIHKTAELVVYAIRNGLVTLRDSTGFLVGRLRDRICGSLDSGAGPKGIGFRPHISLFGRDRCGGHPVPAQQRRLRRQTATRDTGFRLRIFLDYDGDGWLDILLVNGSDWPGHKRQRSSLRLYRNNRNGTFTDVTRSAGLDIEMYGMGVAVGDYNNDGFLTFSSPAWGRAGFFAIPAKELLWMRRA